MRKTAVVFGFLCAALCRAGIIYVDDSATGADNGTSWVDAYKFLQNALSVAISDDTIQVAQGIYRPDESTSSPGGTGDRTATFTLKNDVTLKGGYAGYGQPDPDARDIGAFETILSGDLNNNDGPNFANNAENSYHVVTGSSTDSTAILEGFTITAGNADGTLSSSQNVGAGMSIHQGNPKVLNCTFKKNTTSTTSYNGGGGIYVYGEPSPTIVNCRFIWNSSLQPISGPSRGGAIFSSIGSPTIINCIFIGNTASQGGAIGSFVTKSINVINCTFFNNTAATGGGMYNTNAATSNPRVRNSIFWGNAGGQITGTLPAVSYSCIQGGLGGTGNNGNDPAFVDAAGADNIAGTEDDDLRLNSGSSCIDAGDNTVLPTDILTDIAGNARFIDDPNTTDTGNGTPPIADKGALEFTKPVVVMNVEPARLDFWTSYGAYDIDSQILSINNIGGGTLNWHVSEDCPWLEAIAADGSCTTETDEVQINVDCNGFGPGSYECQLIVSGENALHSPQTVLTVLHVIEIPPSEFWRDYLEFPDDPFKSDVISQNDPGWVKFTMIQVPPYNPDTVYFQDSKAYPFHYEFATEFLTPFIGMTSNQYNQVSLYAAGQQAALGAVIMSADTSIKEYGIQFIRYDAYTKEEIAAMFNAVKASIAAAPDVQAFYFPSYEQLAVANNNQAWFESQGIPIGSTARWAAGNACYSSGWALGILKYFAGSEIQSAYAAGLLLPEDILLTDGVPAEVPFVAGILSLLPSTPSSHVALLAQTFGIPFGHLALTADAQRAQELIGQLVLVSVGETDGVGSIGMKDLTGLLTQDQINQILALKDPAPLEITPIEDYGSYSENTDGLMPDDIRYFGGKAANFGILRRTIPDRCPKAVAFSFRLWNEFLDQILGSGWTLRDEINSRLSVYTYPPPDLPALYADLEYIREELFKNTNATSFTQQQTDAVIAILQDPNYGFDLNSNIRFRSSTNVEDANQFSGAGLYDSFSGCLADDLDGDTQGPCICDPEESKERGVFRAIRKVYASFYNDNAFLERLRHGIDENAVGMGLLVHHSAPDPFELANGVATLQKRQGDANRYIKLITQKDAVSVANPNDGSIPEEVSVRYVSESEIEVALVRSSNLVILGQTVLQWQQEYIQMAQYLVEAAEEFESITGKTDYLLDYEYKKLLEGGAELPAGGLLVKQIREIPKSEQSVNVNSSFLVNEPVTYETFQGEGGGDIYSKHRLKSRWTLNTKSMWMTPENIRQGIYSNVSIEYAADGRIRTLNGSLPLLPFVSNSFAGTTATNSWIMHHLYNPRTYTLTTSNIKTQVGSAESPIVTLSDFGQQRQPTVRTLSVQANYALPGGPTTDTIEICRQLTDYLYRQRLFTYGKISITTSFYYAYWESMILTYPLSRFIETHISGLTTQPIVLHGYYSQTLQPGHHNFSEVFLFEPRLEPGISPSILDQLEAANIHLIYFFYDQEGTSSISTLSSWDLPFLTADIDNNGKVDLADLSVLSLRWLDSVCDDCGGADLTGDGCVDIDDLQELANEWMKDLS